MARKKPKSISQSSISTKPCSKATPQRKSCRKTVLNSKINGNKKSQINEIPVKNSKKYLKNMKIKDISNQCKFKENSSQPTENGIYFGIRAQNKTALNSCSNDDENSRINKIPIRSCKVLLRKIKIKDISNIKLNKNSFETTGDSISFGIKVENESLLPTPSKFKVDIFEENKNALKKSHCLIKSNDLINNSSGLNSKYQRKSKRKAIDLNETNHAFESPKKPKKGTKTNNVVPKEEIDNKCRSNLSIIKKEIDFPSALDESPSSMNDESVLEVLSQHEFKTQLDVNSFPSKECVVKDSYEESSSDTDWEEVEERKEPNLENYNPIIPKEGVEITVDCPQFNVRKKRKQKDKMEHIRLQINRVLREHQLNTHKTHLLCLLAHGLSVNNVLNAPILKALALSLLPNDILALTSGRKINKINTAGIKNIVSWFRESFKFENKQLSFTSIEKSLISYFQEQKSLSASEYNLMFVVVARTLGFKTRFCVSLYPLTHKAKHLFEKNKTKKNIRIEETSSEDDDLFNDQEELFEKVGEKRKSKTEKKDIHLLTKKTKSRPKRSTEKSYKISCDESDDDDEDFDIEKELKQRKRTSEKNKKTKSRPKRSTEKSYKISSDESDDDDEDFDIEKELKRIKRTSVKNKKTKSRPMRSTEKSSEISSDEDDEDFHIKKEEFKLTKRTSVNNQKTISRPKLSTEKNYKISSDDEDFDIEKEEEFKRTKRISVKNKKSKSGPKRFTKKSHTISSDESDDDDEDFDLKKEETFKRTKRSYVKQLRKKSKRNILADDSEPPFLKNCNRKLDNIVCWCEVFSQPDKQWVSVECSKNIISEPYNIEKLLFKPVTYIVAYDNESYVKDVTRRYCKSYMTSTLKMRVVNDWWKETLEHFSPLNSKQDKEEEEELDDMLVNTPLPNIISEFKNHPLYALKRHLLKFEAIYPPDAAPVGFLRGEPIYARDCVCKLKAREKWGREARVVRVGEEPYNVVKTLKWDKINRKILRDVPLEIFGFWQTDPYEPPTAVDGKVPRNEYGNVELFKPCMLPKGTVHLRNPGLNRVAKKLGIDCSQALIGFDGDACKGIFPVYDGFVVCTEFKDTLLAAWDIEQENSRKRAEEKREKRIYGNWKKLIRGLLIRERIKLKYDVK